MTARCCPPISLNGTTTTSTAVPPWTNDGSGRLLRRHRLLDCYIQQTGSVSFPSCRLAPVGRANRRPNRDDRGRTLEWLNALSDASTRTIAAEGYRRVHADRRIEVVPFQPELNDAAIGLYRNRADKNWSLTDCLSFVVMERRALTEAITTDRHFEQAGFKANMLDHPGA